MKYPNGDAVELGDELELWPGCRGVVVVDNDNKKARADYMDLLGHLEVGVYVLCDAAGLVHYHDELEHESFLLKRADRP